MIEVLTVKRTLTVSTSSELSRHQKSDQRAYFNKTTRFINQHNVHLCYISREGTSTFKPSEIVKLRQKFKLSSGSLLKAQHALNHMLVE